MSVEFDTETGQAKAVRTVRQSGNSTVVVIPPELLQIVDFDRGDDVSVTVDDAGEIVIRASESTHE